MKKLLFILLVFLVLSLLYRIWTYHHLTTRHAEPPDESLHARYEFALPRSLSFAGEKIPLEDRRVREQLIHLLIENSYDRSRSLEMHKLTGRWFPMIEKLLKKYGVPDDFKYLVLVESGFGSDVSHKGASGFWQFIPSTARQYGLEINGEVDERYDPEKATRAACRYILDSYKRFHNWTLTAASYNMGPEALQRQMKKQQEKSYFDLILNRETSVYLFKVLAMKEIISRPRLYGYTINKRQFFSPIPVKAVTIDSAISDLNAFAESQGTSMAMLRLLNPWLLGKRLSNPEHKTYTIKILKTGFENLPGLNLQPDSLEKPEPLVPVTDSLEG